MSRSRLFVHILAATARAGAEGSEEVAAAELSRAVGPSERSMSCGIATVICYTRRHEEGVGRWGKGPGPARHQCADKGRLMVQNTKECHDLHLQAAEGRTGSCYGRKKTPHGKYYKALPPKFRRNYFFNSLYFMATHIISNRNLHVPTVDNLPR